MSRLHCAALFLATTLPCLANDRIPFPPLQEGEWTMSTSVVLSNGERHRTPESTIACIVPTRKMQEDIDGMKKQGCTPRTTAVGKDSVSYIVACAGKGGDQLVTVTLTAPDERSYRQVLATKQGTNELRGRWLGPCKVDAGPTPHLPRQ